MPSAVSTTQPTPSTIVLPAPAFSGQPNALVRGLAEFIELLTPTTARVRLESASEVGPALTIITVRSDQTTDFITAQSIEQEPWATLADTKAAPGDTVSVSFLLSSKDAAGAYLLFSFGARKK